MLCPQKSPLNLKSKAKRKTSQSLLRCGAPTLEVKMKQLSEKMKMLNEASSRPHKFYDHGWKPPDPPVIQAGGNLLARRLPTLK
jgi:hypothetical protein